MILKELIRLFERDTEKLKIEITAYSSEENLWKVSHAITNSGGNLCLHLLGNMYHFIGKEIGGFHYIRDREFEFAGNNVSKATLITKITELQDRIRISLVAMDESKLEEDYPLEVFGSKITHFSFLMHLFGHLNYHLGQINYHRRLLDNESGV